jgi:hypothetical protein
MRAALVAACLFVGCYHQNPPPQYSYGAPKPAPPPQQTQQGTCVDGDLCSSGYDGYPQGYPPGYIGDGYPSGYRQGETCVTGAHGQVACGYDCKVGTAGIPACSNFSGGTCASGSDGHVYCTTR